MPLGLLLEILAAGGVSAAVCLLAWPWWRRGWAAALAVGGGCATSYLLARGLPALAPVDATELLFGFALAGAGLGLLEVSGWFPRGVPVWRAVACLSVAWLLLRGLPAETWQPAVCALALFLVWSLLGWRAERLEGASLPLVLLITAAGSAVALEQARSGFLGQMAGAVAAACGPLLLLALIDPAVKMRGAIAPAALFLGALLICGHFFAELDARSALLLAAAPLCAVRRWWLGALLAALLAGAAIYLIVAGRPPDP